MKNSSIVSLKEKIGQMLLIGISSIDVVPKIKDIIKKYKIGGVILYRNNYQSYDEMIKLINDLKNANKNNRYPLFIAIDQENGRVNRLPKEIKKMYSAYSLVQTKDVSIIEEVGNITGDILLNSGINMNFAPVLDIKRFSDNQALGNRCYGDNADDVSKYGIPFMKKLKDNQIISVIKHFPGHGSTKINSHYFLPIIINKKNLFNNDIKPFEKAIDFGADAIMIGHLLVPSISLSKPLSLSKKFITYYLRDKGYNGLIMCDDLKMKAITLIYGKIKASSLAINAGNDLIMLKYYDNDEVTIYDKLINISASKLNVKQINDSFERIIKIKEKYKINDNIIINKLNIDKINKRIEAVNEEVKRFTS